jgi:hypothetical protein
MRVTNNKAASLARNMHQIEIFSSGAQSQYKYIHLPAINLHYAKRGAVSPSRAHCSAPRVRSASFVFY